MATDIVIDETNIKNIIKALKDMLNDIDKEVDDTMVDILKKGEAYLDAQYTTRLKDPNITDISTSWSKKGDEYELKAIGKDVIYEEFGTGDRGEQKPHPVKSKYNLNDYNSGQYIRNVSDYDENSYTYDDLQEFGINSGKFWRYNKNGVLYYTQGIPAGQEMWDTRNYLIKNVIPEVSKKRGEYICEKFKRAIEK